MTSLTERISASRPTATRLRQVLISYRSAQPPRPQTIRRCSRLKDSSTQFLGNCSPSSSCAATRTDLTALLHIRPNRRRSSRVWSTPLMNSRHDGSNRFSSALTPSNGQSWRPACTLAGLGVKARHAANVLSQYWETPIDQIDWDARAVRLLIEAVCDVAHTPLLLRNLRDEG